MSEFALSERLPVSKTSIASTGGRSMSEAKFVSPVEVLERDLELAGTESRWVTVAQTRLKASDRGLELVSVSNVWIDIYADDPAWLEEELEVWGIRKKFRARFYRWQGFKDEDGESEPDLNRWYIAIGDLEEAGELELWF